IRRRTEHTVERRPRRQIAQGVEPRAVELGTAVAVVAEEVSLSHDPARLARDVLLQARHLLLDRLRLLLALRRHPDIERYPHGPWPPAARPPLSTAGGVGRRDPTELVHH